MSPPRILHGRVRKPVRSNSEVLSNLSHPSCNQNENKKHNENETTTTDAVNSYSGVFLSRKFHASVHSPDQLLPRESITCLKCRR